MKKTILLFLTLTLILGVFSSCGYKTVDIIDDETSSSPSEDTTIASEETTEETDEEIDTESSEESIETTSYIETVNTTETMESIETDNGVVQLPAESVEYPAEYTYTVKKVDGKWYMDFDSYVTPGTYVHREVQFATTSFEQLYTDIINDNFPETLKEALIDKYRTENGVPIINFDELYVPVIPSTMVFGEYIVWERDTYSTSIHDYNNKEITASLDPISKTEFEETKAWALFYNGSAYGMRILTESDKTIIVDYKNYSGGTGPVYVYVNQGNGYFRYHFRNFLPSDDFLLQFGAKKFQIPEQ